MKKMYDHTNTSVKWVQINTEPYALL